MAKHFELAITDTSFAWSRKAEAIAAEAALDGLYVIRSNLPHGGFPAAAIVLAYKGLSHAERGFRDLKSGDLDVRPIQRSRPACTGRRRRARDAAVAPSRPLKRSISETGSRS